jgi:N-acetylneuraminate synthase/N,N'-diacetyllegionaminate synthase
MTEQIRINNRPIGAGQHCYVIAEAGVNHNGKLEVARELVRQAKRAGADCVKFQTFRADRLVSQDAPKANYQLRTTSRAESQVEMLRKLEMPESWHRDLAAACRDEGVDFLSTPYSFEDADFLDQMDVVAFKLASIHCAEPIFVRYVAAKGRPLILSTGMAWPGSLMCRSVIPTIPSLLRPALQRLRSGLALSRSISRSTAICQGRIMPRRVIMSSSAS